MSRQLSGRHYERAVIEAAARAAAANATHVSCALTAYCAAATAPDLAEATGQLYRALVAQAAGHESAANGATYQARCQAAREALDAWGAGSTS